MIPHFTPGLHRRYPETRALLHGHAVTKTIRQIIAEVGAKHGFKVAEMLGRRGCRALSKARREAYWRCTQETKHSTATIARQVGNKDHSSVAYAVRKYRAENGL